MTATLVGDVAHHRQIVGDEEVGEAEPLLQVLQQVDDLALDRHVERRDRLVADDDARLDARARGRCRRAGAGRPRARADSAAPCRGRARPAAAAPPRAVRDLRPWAGSRARGSARR